MRTFRMINTAEQHQISGLGFITTPDAFIPWRGVKVSGIVLFLKLMTLCNIKAFRSLHPQKNLIRAITLRKKPSGMKKRAAFLRG